jgi:primosomal replication protein N''
VALLATSTSTLEARWHEKRRLFPEATHLGLGIAMDRRAPSDEELIILVGAEFRALRPAEDVLTEARRLASEAEVAEFEPAIAHTWFDQSRSEIFDALKDRLRGFRRCGRQRADDWADAFRLERRLSLARALVLLAIPEDQWCEPPKQQYVQNILDFFNRRLVSAVQRGPLVRLTISRTSTRLDLSELGTAIKPASVLLEVVLGRSGQSTSVDPSVLLSDLLREQRLRRLIQTAAIYRRDTGIHALYMGFPFLLMRDARSDETAMPRVAPVLLWPISIEAGTGARGQARITFDRERDEVRLNPAFESMLGSDRVVGWREAAEEILRRDTIRLTDVMGVFGTLAEADGQELRPMPPTDLKMKIGESRLRCSAAVFLCDFSGQTIAEDLRLITQRTVHGTALEVAIRVGGINGGSNLPHVSETDRYFTVEADPSQESAVFQARSRPGLVIQGPPGTGKSQTIVNIISDCIGRGERVLVVCQKQAALEVVRKRLAAEGLENRLFLLDDTVSDRRPTLLALRAQLETIANRPISLASRLRTERESLAQRIEALEAALNENSEALHRPDPSSGQSYREVLAQLLGVEDGVGPSVPLPSLRPLLGPMRLGEVEQLCEEVGILAPLWLESQFENSPLHALRPFGSDPDLIEEFSAALAQLTEAEAARKKAAALHPFFFEIEAQEPLAHWLSTHELRLRGVSERAATNLARWYDIFCPGRSSDNRGNTIISSLEQTAARLELLLLSDHDTRVSPKLTQIPDGELRTWGNVAVFLSRPASKLSLFNPRRALRRGRLRAFLRPLGLDVDPTSLSAFSRAAALELALRPERDILGDARVQLGEATAEAEMLLEIRRSAVTLLSDVKEAFSAAEAIATCPLPEPALEVVRRGEASRYRKWLDACHSSLHRFAAKRASLARLAEVGQWMQPAWVRDALELITGNYDTSANLAQIVESFPAISAFQRFRVRAQGLSQSAAKAFAVLRAREKAWRQFSAAELTVEVRRTLKREALLAWKNDIEAHSPALLVERAEVEANIRTLAELDQRFKRLNQELLAGCPEQPKLAARREWDDVLMLTGPRARRLREVVERGERLGLFLLRPVWLCSPDMVSRLFGLRPGMFDIVVFDEASQLPVESALPALFRAKRFVVSGDEKQLPPTNFFNARFGSDEEELDDDWLESDSGEMEDESRRQREEALNRREVKDCGDLLALAQTVLPTTTLEIHYRSKYRQLIAFSNSAFYSGRLNIPAQHPRSEILRARPIEVIRAESEYRGQTNPGEARRIVDLLREVWLERPKLQRPSLGVVTFNHKQADLIWDQIWDQANEDPAFRAALAEERQRKQNGEDMSFFVKNLENVQGDERD